MSNLKTVEIKAFVPAKDYALSQAFYRDLGFTMASDGGGVSYFHHGSTSFLLCDFYVQALAENLSMHLLVEDVQAWWAQVQASGVVERYDLRITPPVEQPWAMIDFTLTDPAGVCWRIAQNIPRKA